MKVLQILPELNAGGVERGTLEIGRFLVGQGHAALVVSNGGRMVPQLEAAGIRHIALPVHRKSLASLFQVRPFRKLLQRERPDLLHIRSRVPGWIAWLAWRTLDPRTRPRLVATVHGFNSPNVYSAIMTRGERVIAVSQSVRDYLRRHYPRVPADVFRVIPRGIEPAQYPRGFQPDPAWLADWHKQFPQLAGRRVLTLPGRITRLKGHEDFFQLLAALLREGVKVHGLVVGDTHPKKQAYRAELEALVQRLGVADRVTFTGHRNDLREVLAISDVVCSLSQQPEAFGRTTLEALALGRPVLAYDHGGVGEQLRDLFPAGRVPPGDARALLETARQLLAGQVTPALVGEPYTLDAMCRATLAVYEELHAAPRA
ncbi:MAG: glycosyltransferase family 4 protein [Limisphaerales bacterium]